MNQNGETRKHVARTALPLLLIPGTLCDARLFAPLLSRLAPRDCEVVSIARVSDTREAAWRILEQAPARFALLGFSLGGIVALEIAALAPGRLCGLALLDSNARPVAPDVQERRRLEAIEGVAGGVGSFVGDDLWPTLVGAAALDDAPLRALMIDMAERLGPETFIRQTQLAISRADSRDRMATLTMPVLVAAGEDDAICPPDMQREMASALSDVVLALIPNAGHFAPLEQPEAMAAHVARWLARVDAEDAQ